MRAVGVHWKPEHPTRLDLLRVRWMLAHRVGTVAPELQVCQPARKGRAEHRVSAQARMALPLPSHIPRGLKHHEGMKNVVTASETAMGVVEPRRRSANSGVTWCLLRLRRHRLLGLRPRFLQLGVGQAARAIRLQERRSRRRSRQCSERTGRRSALRSTREVSFVTERSTTWKRSCSV